MTRKTQKIETVIIGGGQAGLATSYYLRQLGREHVVLERAAAAGHAWRSDRWDSFTLVSPNWTIKLPGAEYQGDDRDGYLSREEIVETFERYVARLDLPVRFNTSVTSVESKLDGAGYRVTADGNTLESANVVMATGLFQKAKIPSFGASLPSSVTQLHSGQYRNPQALPPGAVLVVGSAQSGCQIAEELYQSGHKVYLCVGSAGRAPRRYRGKDAFEWMYLTGVFDRTVDKLPSPKAKFAGNPHVSGKAGGHTLNLHQFARDGVSLLGRIAGARDGRVYLVADLKDNLAKADKFEADLLKMVDDFIAANGLDAPEEALPELRDGYDADEVRELSLASAGITTVIWAMGYTFDFGLVKLPVTDSDGYPIQQRGVTSYPGLYFIGLPWQHKYKSGLLLGVAEDAEYIVSVMTGKA